MFKKKKGAANVIIICFMGLTLLLLYLLMGLDMLQYQYVTAELNECVSEAILAADYSDQYMGNTYGYNLFDCSDISAGRCNDITGCHYANLNQIDAFNRAYYKAESRFKNSLMDSLCLSPSLSVTGQTPCGVLEVKVHDFRTYNYIDAIGAGIGLSEGFTYIKSSASGAGWHENASHLIAPNNDEVNSSGIYVEVEFSVKMFLGTTVIPVRDFVGIKKKN